MYFFKIEGEFATLAIKAQPSAPKSEFAGAFGDHLKIKIKAKPIEGEANIELINFLSKEFKIAKSEIEIISGDTARYKRVKLPITQKLQAFLDSFE